MKKKRTFFDIFIDNIERIGNKLPHPFWLFVFLSVIVIIVSGVLSYLGVETTILQASRIEGEAPELVTVSVNNLMNTETIAYIFKNMTSIYASFAPLGIVMIMMLGVGMLEEVGMFSALIRKVLIGAPTMLLLFVIAFVGVNADLASDAGVVIVPTVAGAVFHSMGLNPWVGIIAGYAAVNGGFTANLFLSVNDVLLTGITESVTTAANINAPVHPMMNYYFIATSTFVIVIATVLVTKFYTIPRIGFQGSDRSNANLSKEKLTADELRGLKWCLYGALLYVFLILALVLPDKSSFRNESGGFLPNSPLTDSIIAIIFFFFFILAIVYGMGSKKITKMSDIPMYMEKGVKNALGFVVIALPASIFIELFSASNLSTMIGAWGGQILTKFNLSGFPLLLIFILFCTFINLFVTSGSAKYLIIAPIFVPILASHGFSPAMTQITYRIADTCTNIISPIDYYVPVIIGLLAMYNNKTERKVGLGTVISMCLPYSIAYLIGLVALLLIWYIFKIDIGPGASMLL